MTETVADTENSRQLHAYLHDRQVKSRPQSFNSKLVKIVYRNYYFCTVHLCNFHCRLITK